MAKAQKAPKPVKPAKGTTTAAPAPTAAASKPAKTAAKPAKDVTFSAAAEESAFQIPKGQGTVKKAYHTSVPLDQVKVEPGFNPRQVFDEQAVDDLAANIKRVGLLHPIVVRPSAGGGFTVVAGERRFRALTKLGTAMIDVQIRVDLSDDAEASAVAVAENADDNRAGLNAIELGGVFKKLETAGWSVAQVAHKTGVSSVRVRRCLTLMDAPSDVRQRVSEGKTSVASALELAKIDEPIRKAIEDALSPDASAADIRKAAKAAAKASESDEGAEAGPDGKANNRKKGADRAKAIVTWKGSREKQEVLRRYAYTLHNAKDDAKDTSGYFELRGVVACILFDRGDLSEAMPPSDAPETKDGKKTLMAFNLLVEAEAAKYVPAGKGSGADADDE